MDRTRIGPYRIEEHLGSGGMGAVYKAFDERLGRWVAIKSILPEAGMSDDRRERLRREARSAAALNHPAISQVHDIIVEDGRDHIVMEYVEGRPLSRLITQAELTLEQAVSIARQTAEGLYAAHSHGVIHRDLKAENVMVKASGQVKILDFGLAKRIDGSCTDESLTKEGTVIGTCRAMSPEQAQGHPLDHRSDLFSLGTLLYTMVTGRHPFAGPTPVETMRRVVYDPVPRADRINPDVPAQLATLIERMLAKDPEDRPADAALVAAALAQIEGIWLATPAPGSSSRFSSELLIPRQRGRRLRLVLLGIVLALIAASVAALWLRHRGEPTVVAVLAPELRSGSDPQTAPLAADAMRVALLNALAGIQGLAALDTAMVDPISGTPREIARATAADEVLGIQIDDCSLTCRITVRRIAGSTGRVMASKLITVPPDDLYLLASSAGLLLSQIYPGRSFDAASETVEVEPDDWDAFVQVWRQIEQPSPGVRRDDLLEQMHQITGRSPRFVAAHCAEAQLARYLYAHTYHEKFLLQGTQAVRRARALAPRDPRPILLDIDLRLASGDHAGARQVLEELRSIDPTYPGMKTRQADLELAQGDCARALALLRQVVRARPSWRSMLDLGRAERHCGEAVAAAGHLLKGLELAPGNRFLTECLAELYLMEGSLHKAEDLYTRLVKDYPNLTNLSNLGATRMLLGEYEAAVGPCEEAAALSRRRFEVLVNLADAYQLSGRQDEARATYAEAIDAAERIGPATAASATAEAVKALSLAHLGRRREAAAAIQQALMLAPLDPQRHYDAAVVDELIGEHSSALAHAEKAIELGMSPIWFQLPWTRPLLEDPTLAKIIRQPRASGPDDDGSAGGPQTPTAPR